MENDIKHMIQVQNPLYDEIKEFCELNSLKINVFINELIEKGFMIEKYGDTPFTAYKIPEPPEKIKPIIINGETYDEERTRKLLDDFINLQHKYDELEDECNQLYSEIEYYKNKPIETEPIQETKEVSVTIEKPVPVKTVKTTTKRRLK